jgi:hypothetical protein
MMEFYILQVKTVDVEYIGKYKDERAYSHWMSGFVDIIHVAKCIGVERSISGGGTIFIHSCSALLIYFEIDCF